LQQAVVKPNVFLARAGAGAAFELMLKLSDNFCCAPVLTARC